MSRVDIPLPYIARIFSSSSFVLVWCFASSLELNSLLRSRGIWIVVSPAEVRSCFGRLPLRLLPLLRPLASYFRSPDAAVSSASSIVSNVLQTAGREFPLCRRSHRWIALCPAPVEWFRARESVVLALALALSCVVFMGCLFPFVVRLLEILLYWRQSSYTRYFTPSNLGR